MSALAAYNYNNAHKLVIRWRYRKTGGDTGPLGVYYGPFAFATVGVLYINGLWT
jgi:hypothetical protein